MKIDRIRVLHEAGRWWWGMYRYKKDEWLFIERLDLTNKRTALAEARYLAKKLGCKLVLPEGGGK